MRSATTAARVVVACYYRGHDWHSGTADGCYFHSADRTSATSTPASLYDVVTNSVAGRAAATVAGAARTVLAGAALAVVALVLRRVG